MHNKLVRDRIPEYLTGMGITAETEEVTDPVRLLRLLLDKLEEEAKECGLADQGHLLEELGDLETVVDGILKLIGQTRAQLTVQQDGKDAKRGALNNGVFLIKTVETEEGDKDNESN